MIHTYLGESISFEINFKKRKSIGLYIDIYGNVEVRAPKGTTEESIIKIIEEKWAWILESSNEMKDRFEGPQKKEYEYGEKFLYLGNSYPIQIFLDETEGQDYVKFEEGTLRIFVKEIEDEKIKQALKRFYYQQCKSLVESGIKFYQSNFKVKPTAIRITDSKKNWGTCDSNRQLTFNWRLAMAPQNVIEYVIVHEMCHMVHKNHDRSFWRLVGKIIPDYKDREYWLAISNWKMTV